MSFKKSVAVVFFTVHFNHLYTNHLFDKKKWGKEKRKSSKLLPQMTNSILNAINCSVSQLHLGFNLQFTDCTMF